MLFVDNNNCSARTCEAYWLHTTQTDNLPSTMLPGHDTFSTMTSWQAIRSEYCDWPTVCHLSICLSVNTIPHYGQTVQGKQCLWSIYGKLISDFRIRNKMTLNDLGEFIPRSRKLKSSARLIDFFKATSPLSYCTFVVVTKLFCSAETVRNRPISYLL